MELTYTQMAKETGVARGIVDICKKVCPKTGQTFYGFII